MTDRNRGRGPVAPSRPRNTAPAIDYSKLTASDTKLPKSIRGGVLDGTPFVEWMTDSRTRGVAKTVTVPVSAETQTVYLIRQAAARIDAGVRIVADKPADGNVKLTFQAKDKRAKLTDAQRAERKAEADRKRAERAAKKAAAASAAK